jgi:hypothetical protein
MSSGRELGLVWQSIVPRKHMKTHRKLWIDIEGNLIPVQDSHEEWANDHGHELEQLLDAGWVRVQDVPPAYLYLDFRLPLKAGQAKSVAVLFENHVDQVVIEFKGEARSIGYGEEALKFTLGQAVEEPGSSAANGRCPRR